MQYEVLIISFSLAVFFIGLGMLLKSLERTQEKGRAIIRKDSTVYLRSLNYVIDNQPDKAIAELRKAVQLNSDTVEVYLNLGRLFREQGKLEKAIRIHQSIILRPSLPREFRILSLMNLGADYKKAGLWERAVETFKEAIKIDPNNLDAHIGLEKLYEEEKNWEESYIIQQKILKLSKSSDKSALAFIQVKLGEEYLQEGDVKQALKRFHTAIHLDETCTPAYLYCGDIYFEKEKLDKAQEIWEKMINLGLCFSFLGYIRLEKLAVKLQNDALLESICNSVLRERPHDVRTRIAFANYYHKTNQFSKAIEQIDAILRFKPHLAEIHKYIIDLILDDDKKEKKLGKYRNLLMGINIPNAQYICEKCGYASNEIMWHCPQCREWNTFLDNLNEIEKR